MGCFVVRFVFLKLRIRSLHLQLSCIASLIVKFLIVFIWFVLFLLSWR